jgi:putative DNA primase/helicase
MSPAEILTSRLPEGRWHGSYGTARCPVHDDKTPSLTIRDGDAAPLVKCHTGCSSREVVDELRRAGSWLEQPSEYRSDRDHRVGQDKGAAALKIWREARPINDTPAEIYLRTRGISGPLPPSLRYAHLKHVETGLFLPVLVAAVQGPDRQIVAIHRTFLRGDGATKAPVSNPRKMLGKVRGGAVRLAAAEVEMAIGEGIETCLSYHRATGIPTWAALSAEGIKAVGLPALPLAAVVHLLVDRDPAGEGACRIAAERLTREGRRIKLCRPVCGKDFNDALNERAHG